MLRSPAIRLSLVLVLFTLNLLFLANLAGLVPSEKKSALELRKRLSESLALQFSTAVGNGEFQTIQHTLRAVVDRNDDIRSAAIRTVEGKLIAMAGEHLAHWSAPTGSKSTSTHVHVPIFKKGKKWATVEIRFAPLWQSSLAGGFSNSFMGLLAFIALCGFICYFFVLKRSLRELDPTAVVPERVQKAFDVLQEGVMVLDEKEQIVMTNRFFAGLLGKSPESMIGLKGSELGWIDCQHPEKRRKLPWFKVLQEGLDHKGATLKLQDGKGSQIKLSVNAVMVADNNGRRRGCLVTFDDITQIEEKNFELSSLVEKLQQSQEEIQSKTQELEFLASQDPLTFCLNRRSLDKGLRAEFDKAKKAGSPLACMMVDIDFFKSVNDRYGHATGDQVIKAVADILKISTRDSDLVGRYGGEEFCVVIPGMDIEIARKVADRIRKAIAKDNCAGVQITASIGVSSLEMNAAAPDELVNQADKALYAAKKGGRNRVCIWGVDDSQDAASGGAQKIPGDKSNLTTEISDNRIDPTQLKRRIQELEGLLEKQRAESDHYEMYDIETGFPTQKLFEDRISQEIARCERTKNLVAVLSITIDATERIKKTLGRTAADQLVKACGDRLNDALRRNIDTVAMVTSSDQVSSVSLINRSELGILFADIKQVDHMTWIIKRLLDTFESPFQIQGQEIYTGAHVGAAIYPFDGKSVEALCTSASNACSYTKLCKGDHRYHFASRDINTAAMRQLQIESLLYRAIEDNELQLHFQPLIESATGRISGFEALLRWTSAELGSVAPGEFIPVAEQSGQILKIGEWVLYQACRQLRAWRNAGIDVGHVAVNVSGLQLQQLNLARRIREILDEFSLKPSQLEIELTESSLVNFHDQSFAMLKQIRDLGIRVAMDDFGTGYSSLAYLRNIPLACIKIDRSFIDGIGKDDHADKLVSSIVSMAHKLGLDVVAEGVEAQHQADYLISLGCEFLQGYFYGRPVPPTAVSSLPGLKASLLHSKSA